MKCEQVHFPAGAPTSLWYERPAVAKTHERTNKRRLLASTPAMTAGAALRAAEAVELVKVGGRPRVHSGSGREG